MERGALVTGLEGEVVGVVDDIRAGSFRVRDRTGEKNWIGKRAIFHDEERLVSLICLASGVSRWYED